VIQPKEALVEIVRDRVSLGTLASMAEAMFGNLVKAVVDVERELMAIDAEMHADEEALLLADGSSQTALWGINLYPGAFATDDFIEFDSMINVRPRQGNRTRFVDDAGVREQIERIVARLVVP
jgi:hypothetical protein